MAKVNGIFETSLYVADLERSTKFYANLFGFETVAAADRMVALGVNKDQLLLLFKKKGSLHLGKLAHDGDGQLHLAFAVAGGDLPEWRATLAREKVAIEAERSWEHGGHSIYFRDPDGHAIELATKGVWPAY